MVEVVFPATIDSHDADEHDWGWLEEWTTTMTDQKYCRCGRRLVVVGTEILPRFG